MEVIKVKQGHKCFHTVETAKWHWSQVDINRLPWEQTLSLGGGPAAGAGEGSAACGGGLAPARSQAGVAGQASCVWPGRSATRHCDPVRGQCRAACRPCSLQPGGKCSLEGLWEARLPAPAWGTGVRVWAPSSRTPPTPAPLLAGLLGAGRKWGLQGRPRSDLPARRAHPCARRLRQVIPCIASPSSTVVCLWWLPEGNS